MAKPTLLAIVQEILNDMTSDEVNSIDETEESDQVTLICKSVYMNMIGIGHWPHMFSNYQLTGLADTSKPTHMGIPDNVIYVDKVRYNKIDTAGDRLNLVEIHYLDPQEFLRTVLMRNEDETDVVAVNDSSGEVLLIKNAVNPTYWTSFDDDFIVFDSYDATLDTTMQASKSSIWGQRLATFGLTDTSVPDLPEKIFPMYVAKCKSACTYKLRQTVDALEEANGRRHETFMKRKNWRTGGGIKFPNYGRK